MKLQAKLTLGYVLLATLMVGIISAMDLVNDMEEHFDSTLGRAELLRKVAGSDVTDTLNSQRAKPLREALRDPILTDKLIGLMANAHAILEIAVVDPETKDVLADSLPDRVGEKSEPDPDFRELVQDTGWSEKLRALFGAQNYQLEELLGPPVIALRVVVAPALIRTDIEPALKQKAKVAIVSVIAAIAITFLFSALAFRPLGRLAQQLDLVTRGEYETEKTAGPKAGRR